MGVKEYIGHAIDQFSQMTILIIGDVMVDAYLLGKASRISPEAPVPIVNCTTEEYRLGGAANVALNIKSMGATPILCSVIGADDMGKRLLSLLTEEHHMSTQGILVSDRRKTTVKSRIISHGQQLLRVDIEENTPLDLELEALLYKQVEHTINHQQIDAILFEDYDKGVITGELIQKVTQLAQEKNIPTLADPKKRNFLNYKNITLFKPNLKEFYEGIGEEFSNLNLQDLQNRCFDFKTKQNIEILMITLSEHGVFVSGTQDLHFPTQVRMVADVSGAGDTVISVTALCLAAKIDLETTIKLSNLAGGQVCEKPGVVPVDKKDLVARYVELYEKK